jgi:hypothetical protein
MKKTLFISLAVVVFVGCASKKEFEPEKIDSKLSYSTSIKPTLVDVARDGATYKSGEPIVRDRGILDIKIPKDFRVVNFSDESLVVTSKDGKMQIITNNGKVKFETKFDEPLMSATLKNDLLAVVLASNTIMLYDISEDRLIYKEPLATMIAQDARLANPIFINDLVVFATLDGRLLFMNSKEKVILRDVAISNRKLFNNVIFLQIDDNGRNLVAATSSKVILINPKSIFNKNIDIRDVIYSNEKIYIFSKSGSIVQLDEKLEVVKEIKFPYAIFSSVFQNDKLYAVEKRGFLLEIENDLSSFKVIELPDEIDKSVFATKDKIYFDTHIVDIK